MNKIIKKVAVVAMALTSTTSCGLYSKFESPQSEQQDIFGENIELIDSSLTKELVSWRELFSDKFLQDYIDSALVANSDMRVAALNVSQAERRLSTAKMAYVPSLSLSAEGTVSSFDGGTALKTYNVPLVASWEIDIFGKLHNAKQMSKTAVEQSREYEQMVRVQLISAVATNYYSLILADSQYKITEKSVKLMASNVEVIKSLMEVGRQNKAAVDQSIANLKQMELTLKSLEQSISEIENNLCLLLNQPPHKIERKESFDINNKGNFSESISLAALSSRPDVRIAELSLQSSFYGVNYSRSQLYPSIRLSGSAGWTNSGGGMITNPGGLLLSALGSITQPLFMAGANRANLKNAKDQYNQQLISFEKALLVGGKEVNDAIVASQILKGKEKLSSERLKSLKSATKTTQELMNGGKATYLEVLIAQNSFLTAQLNNQTLLFDKCVNTITLFKALGGGRR